MGEELFERLSGISYEDQPRVAQVRWRRPSLEIEDLEGQVRRKLEKAGSAK